MKSSAHPVILAFLTILMLACFGLIPFSSTEKFQLSYEDVSSYLRNILRNNTLSEEDKRYGFCQRRKFEKGHPFTALSSVPGSGNTWVRYLMEQITGKRQSNN